MKNLKLLSIVFGFATLVIVGCKKGDRGPAGAAGTANVLHSDWITLTTTLDVTDSIYKASISASGITAAIIDSGVVLSYIGVPGGATNGTDTAVFSLSEASTYYGTITQQFSIGEIDLLALYDYTGALYRYVLIPGSVVTNGIGGVKYTKQQLKTMSYADAQKTFGLATGTKTPN